MLSVEAIDVFYGDVQVLRGVSLAVRAREVVALVGSNSSGKTTCLRTISGLLCPAGGAIRFDEAPITGLPPHAITEMGLGHVPEGRKIFKSLTVRENLELGAITRRARPRRQETMREVFDLFPVLDKRRMQAAGTLSGGEQQMLAIGRGLMGLPKLLMLDELSLGLAPLMVQKIMRTVHELNRATGVAILLIEQNVRYALQFCQRAYVLQNGRIVLEGSGAELLHDETVKRAYLGM